MVDARSSGETIAAHEPSSRPGRVLHLITHMAVGGAQKNTLHTARFLNERGWEVHIACGRPPDSFGGSLMDEARALGVPVFFEPALARDISPGSDLLATVRLARLIRRGGYQVVHTHSSKAGILGRVAARLARVPVVVHTVHGWGFHDYQSPLARKVYVAAERLAARWTDQLITVSDRDARLGVEEGIAEGADFETIRSGIDLERFSQARSSASTVRAGLGIPADARVVGTVTRLCEQKDPLTFVEAAGELARDRDDLHFLVIGDGPMRPEVEERAHALGLQGRFHITGMRDDVPELLRASDLFCLTSLWEGLPRVVPEAMAAGVPVVATRVCGTPEAVADGETGLLVSPCDSHDVAEGVGELLDDPDRAAELAHNARTRVAPHFCQDLMARDIESVYQRRIQGEAPEASQRVRVLYLITELELGGAQASLGRLLSGLDRDRYEPFVACLFGGDGATARRIRELGIPVFDLGMNGQKRRLDALGRLSSLIRRLRPTVLQSLLFHADLVARTVGRASGVPIVITSRRNTRIGGAHREAARRLTASLDDRVVAVCEAARQAEITHAGADPAKVVTIPNGIDTRQLRELSSSALTRQRARLGADSASPLFGFVGRLHRQKGLHNLLDAFGRLRERHDHARLAIVGDGDERRELEDRARALHLSRHIVFTGEISNAREWLGAFDAFVLPSLYEGVSNSLLEAMAARVPVVATRVGGTPDLVAHRQTGLLVEPGDVHGLHEALDALVGDPARRRELGHAGRDRIERHFALETMVGRTQALYEELTEHRSMAA